LFFTPALLHVSGAVVNLVALTCLVAVVMGVPTATIWVPIVSHVRVPRSLDQRLVAARNWLDAHGHQITVGVCLVFGVYLLVRAALMR
ncbi:MAG: hypothetical protein JJU45_07190, partial [Acidimicrobiia bacterium]|nr:hypothetical protein [Acidimicrobiia bacterium]